MKKLKFFVDFDKEESWLNRQAADGQLLTRVRAAYTFAPVSPGKAVVRIDCQPYMSQRDFEGYITRLANSGWRHFEGSRWGGRQYFASFTDEPDADIFTGKAAKAQRYRRSIANRAPLLLLLLPMLTLWTRGAAGQNSPGSPGDWYLTPGLWGLHGWEFALAFLLETPFVLLRVGAPIFLFCFGLVQLIQVAYHWVLYRRRIAQPAL